MTRHIKENEQGKEAEVVRLTNIAAGPLRPCTLITLAHIYARGAWMDVKVDLLSLEELVEALTSAHRLEARVA
jgi:hypothetical protein